jgi:hypothetical protein
MIQRLTMKVSPPLFTGDHFLDDLMQISKQNQNDGLQDMIEGPRSYYERSTLKNGSDEVDCMFLSDSSVVERWLSSLHEDDCLAELFMRYIFVRNPRYAATVNKQQDTDVHKTYAAFVKVLSSLSLSPLAKREIRKEKGQIFSSQPEVDEWMSLISEINFCDFILWRYLQHRENQDNFLLLNKSRHVLRTASLTKPVYEAAEKLGNQCRDFDLVLYKPDY